MSTMKSYTVQKINDSYTQCRWTKIMLGKKQDMRQHVYDSTYRVLTIKQKLN